MCQLIMSTTLGVLYSLDFSSTPERSDIPSLCIESDSDGRTKSSPSSFVSGSWVSPNLSNKRRRCRESLPANVRHVGHFLHPCICRKWFRQSNILGPYERIEFEERNEYPPSPFICLTHLTVRDEGLRRRLSRV